MKGFALFIAFMAAWFVLNRWVLPWCGISTCMSGGCSADRCPTCESGPWNTPANQPPESNGTSP
jgi:hypothetical protein